MVSLEGRAGENIFSICVSLIGILRVGIAKHHAVEVVSKSQPLKLNSERALTPTVHWHIRLADTVCMVLMAIACDNLCFAATMKDWNKGRYVAHIHGMSHNMCSRSKEKAIDTKIT